MNDDELKDEFHYRFTSIMSLMVDLHSNFGMYKCCYTDDKRDEYVNKCNNIRSNIINCISELSVTHQSFLNDQVFDMILVPDDELEDITYAGLMDYGNYKLEDFFNFIINECYRIHNEIILDTQMKSIGVKYNEIVYNVGG